MAKQPPRVWVVECDTFGQFAPYETCVTRAQAREVLQRERGWHVTINWRIRPYARVEPPRRRGT
jgi:hypothetical protein